MRYMIAYIELFSSQLDYGKQKFPRYSLVFSELIMKDRCDNWLMKPKVRFSSYRCRFFLLLLCLVSCELNIYPSKSRGSEVTRYSFYYCSQYGHVILIIVYIVAVAHGIFRFSIVAAI
jgi:hypothetical protein